MFFTSKRNGKYKKMIEERIHFYGTVQLSKYKFYDIESWILVQPCFSFVCFRHELQITTDAVHIAVIMVTNIGSIGCK